MSRDPFKSFVDLIQFDQTLLTNKQKYNQILDDITLLEEEESEIATRVEQAHHTFLSVKKKVSTNEAKMAYYQDEEKLIKQKLETVASSKEYGSLSAQLQSIKKNQYDFEETLLQSWHELEGADRIYQEELKKLEQKKQATSALIQEKTLLLDQLRGELQACDEKRKELLDGIPEEWLEKYELLREKIKDPIVPVEADACSACYYILPEPQLAALRRRALLQCKGCFRFLYLPSVHPEGIAL